MGRLRAPGWDSPVLCSVCYRCRLAKLAGGTGRGALCPASGGGGGQGRYTIQSTLGVATGPGGSGSGADVTARSFEARGDCGSEAVGRAPSVAKWRGDTHGGSLGDIAVDQRTGLTNLLSIAALHMCLFREAQPPFRVLPARCTQGITLQVPKSPHFKVLGFCSDDAVCGQHPL